MKSLECRATRREIDELEFGAGPGPRAQEHLATCKACRQFRAERTELRELVRSLEPVVAPADRAVQEGSGRAPAVSAGGARDE